MFCALRGLCRVCVYNFEYPLNFCICFNPNNFTCEYLNSYALSYIMPFKNKMASKLLYENILFRSSSFIIVLVGVSMSVVDILLFKFLHSASGYDIMLLADDIKVMSFVDWQQ
ncbi:hypothetical protein T4B_6208 [Trichinella pseudospiralis]|uniref:Uncharacterized protein n=1 Tax=Trichinella pseudospiralis TaxID=6337 RepID=A0A0V1HZY2_TRIPS|nr:hypothetical protein T4B_6208 [Trichinella pseudospiralis]